MIGVTVFRAEDAVDLGLSDAQAMRALGMAAAGTAFTVRSKATGAVVMIGGACASHPQWATMWAEFAPGARQEARGIVRATRDLIAKLPHRRVDVMVRAGNEEGVRLVRLMGFRLEAVLTEAFEDGADAMLFRHAGTRGGMG